MTSKKRKYGDLSARPSPIEDPTLIDDVFAAFTGTRPSSPPAADSLTSAPAAVEPEPPSTPAQRATPARDAAPAWSASAAQQRPEPLHDAGAARHAAPAQPATVAGYTRVPNDLLDRILPTLDPYDQAVLVRLFRLARGFNSDTCRVSIPTLAKACNVSERQARISVGRLEGRELVRRIGQDFGNSDRSLRGTTFLILISDATPARGATPARYATHVQGAAPARGAANKDKALKENSKRGVNRLSPDEIQSFTSTVVDLLAEGKSVEEIEVSYAPSMHPADWAVVKSVALAQATPKRKTERDR